MNLPFRKAGVVVCLFLLNAVLGAETFRIATANIYFANTQVERATQRLVDTDADVLVLLEWNQNNVSTDLEADYRLLVGTPIQGPGGIAVFVRRDLIGVGAIVHNPIDSPCAMPVATARVFHGQQWYTIVGVHAPPPLAACGYATDRTIEAIQEWLDDGRMSRQVGVARPNDPVLVVGDFNALPWNDAIREFDELGFHDAGDDVLYGGTWSPGPAIPKMARIDYVFVPEDFTARRTRTVRIPGSDHKAVVVDIDTPGSER